MINKEEIPEKIGIKLDQFVEDHKKAKFDTIAAFAFSSEKQLGTLIMLATQSDYLLEVCLHKMLTYFFDGVVEKQAYMYWLQDRLNEIKEKYNLE